MEECAQAGWAQKALQEGPIWETPISTLLSDSGLPRERKTLRTIPISRKCQHSLKEVSIGLEISRLSALVISTINKTMRPI